jgi:hypothetical protein
MKKFVLSMALAALASTSAFAQQQRAPLVTSPGFGGDIMSVECRDTRNIADGGILARIIERGQFQMLEVSEVTRRSRPRVIGRLMVRQMTGRDGNLNFVGQGVTLSINQNFLPFRQEAFSGMPGFIRGVVNTVRLDHDVTCMFFARAL